MKEYKFNEVYEYKVLKTLKEFKECRERLKRKFKENKNIELLKEDLQKELSDKDMLKYIKDIDTELKFKKSSPYLEIIFTIHFYTNNLLKKWELHNELEEIIINFENDNRLSFNKEYNIIIDIKF